jgi:hypothetical protein
MAAQKPSYKEAYILSYMITGCMLLTNYLGGGVHQFPESGLLSSEEVQQ